MEKWIFQNDEVIEYVNKHYYGVKQKAESYQKADINGAILKKANAQKTQRLFTGK